MIIKVTWSQPEMTPKYSDTQWDGQSDQGFFMQLKIEP